MRLEVRDAPNFMAEYMKNKKKDCAAQHWFYSYFLIFVPMHPYKRRFWSVYCEETLPQKPNKESSKLHNRATLT